MLVITTPTGQIGSQTLDLVLRTDHPVRVIARDPGRLPARVRDHADVVQGSSTDADLVTRALDGADGVLWVTPPDASASSVPGHAMSFVQPLCQAIATGRVRRVVAVSSLGRGVARHAGQASAALGVDHLIESTGVDYRALCPPGFMDNLLWQIESIVGHGTTYSTIPPDVRLPTCATRDIATVAAELLLDDGWGGQDSVPLPGPEDLSPDDMSQTMSAVLGRPIRNQWISPADYQAALLGAGMSEAWARGLVEMTTEFARGALAVEPATPRTRTPTTFARWCEDVLKPAVQATEMSE